MGAVHPAEADMVDLEKYISGMPGGEYIGDRWKDEPKVVVAVYMSDIVYTSDILDIVQRAYPPRLYGDEGMKWAAEYLFHVPRTVAQLLAHYPLVTDERESEGTGHPLDERSVQELGEVTEEKLDLLLSLWTPRALEEHTLEDAVDRIVKIREVAGELEEPFSAVLEVVQRLWEEDLDSEFDEMLETAAAVLA